MATVWNKGMKGRQSWHDTSGLGKNIDFKKRGKSISKAMTGMKRPDSYKEKRAELMKQKWADPEYRALILKSREGKMNPWNKGKGISSIERRLRMSKEYALWRTAVLMRDDYTCQKCNIRGGKLQVDHIKPFALYPELRLAIDNGRVLCVDCHRQTDTWGVRAQRVYRKESLD